MIVANACAICRHLDPEALTIEVDGEPVGRCAAFPDGIPYEIWDGDHAHQVPFAEEEILFEVAEGQDVRVYLDVYTAAVGEPPEGLATTGVDD